MFIINNVEYSFILLFWPPNYSFPIAKDYFFMELCRMVALLCIYFASRNKHQVLILILIGYEEVIIDDCLCYGDRVCECADYACR